MLYSFQDERVRSMDKKPAPLRVLVVSHNVFSASGNMGKTMMRMLAGISPENLAQVYFHQEIPTRTCCLRYFRITDSDVLRSVFTRRARFRIFSSCDIDESASQSRTDTGNLAKVYQFSRRRTPMIYFLRDTMWRLGKWKTRALKDWARAFAPDVIFFAAGDYAFSYRVALYLSGLLRVPITMWCADDYFIAPQQSRSLLRRLHCRRLRKLAQRVTERSKSVITISDTMQRDYAQLFGFPVQTIRISSDANPAALPRAQREGISYVGNLGIDRITPLIELGRALKAAQLPGFETIRVYSGERNPATLAQITEENGLTFCGRLTEQGVERVLGASKFLILVESFDRSAIRRTKYSLSTKVAESLRSGACIIAYGPDEIASIEYLCRHKAACILNSAAEFPEVVRRLCTAADEYDAHIQCAQSLAEQFHSAKTNETCIEKILAQASGMTGTPAAIGDR